MMLTSTTFGQTVIFDNTNNSSTIWTLSSDLRGRHPDSTLVNVTDDFTIPVSESWSIDSFICSGDYYGGGSVLPDSFMVVFYDENSGAPGAIIHREAFVQTSLVNIACGLATPLVLSEGTYWVSIYAVYNTLQNFDMDGWTWEVGISTNGSGAMLQDFTGLFGPPINWTLLTNLAGYPQNSCMFKLIGDISAGINDVDNNAGIEVYPNPTTDYININSTEIINRVSLINNVGQIVLTQEVNETTIKLSADQLAEGTYFLRVETDNVVTNATICIIQ